MNPKPFVPPPYPYDRLNEISAVAGGFEGGAINLSVGTPTDAPPKSVVDALGQSDSERSYPPSIGTVALREAATGWIESRFGVSVDPGTEVGATIGTKEFVVGLPHWLRLRRPDLDTVLYPAVSYPSYAMGATLAGCREVPVAIDSNGRLDLGSINPGDAARALCLWSNSPANPTGALEDLKAVAEWGVANDVLVFSDECYAEFTWTGDPDTAIRYSKSGVVAVHSLSKRSNLAGVRAGFYAGDAEIVHYLQEVRKHSGFMVPGPSQAAAVAALGDQSHVEIQREIYWSRIEQMCSVLDDAGIEATKPDGAFYLWIKAPDGDAWAFARELAECGGAVVSPGEFYGESAAPYVRIALVQPAERLELFASRLLSNKN